VLDREQDFTDVLRSALSAHRCAPACDRA